MRKLRQTLRRVSLTRVPDDQGGLRVAYDVAWDGRVLGRLSAAWSRPGGA